MKERWSRARLGGEYESDGKRWCVVHVECAGDPRGEVLEALEAAELGAVTQRVVDARRERPYDGLGYTVERNAKGKLVATPEPAKRSRKKASE